MYGIEREREREKIKKYIRVKKNKIKKLRAAGRALFRVDQVVR